MERKEGMRNMGFDIANVRQHEPSKGKAIVYWLGGAGFAFRFNGGQVICVDPYLSDAAERLFGFRRLSLAPVKAGDLACDLLLITHDHADHLDIDSFDALMTANPGCCVLAPECCSDFLESKKAAYEVVSPGMVSQLGQVTVKTVPADHGDLCLSAVGFVIGFAGRSVYLTGDTGLNENLVREAIGVQPEIVIPCINGVYGNMNEREAAILARKCGARMAIPSHFWLFAEHGGSPERFRNSLKAEAPTTDLLLLTPGRGAEV